MTSGSPIAKHFAIQSSMREDVIENYPVHQKTAGPNLKFKATNTSEITIYHVRPTTITKSIYPIKVGEGEDVDGLICLPKGVAVCA